MKHDVLDVALRERAALHAMGALPPDEAAAFSAHAAECATCAAEAAAWTPTLAALGEATAPAVTPPPGLRARLLDAARTATPATAWAGGDAAAAGDPYLFVHAHEGAWRDVLPGVQRKDLAGGPSPSYLIRLAPGAEVVAHGHARIEHCLVVSGHVDIVGRECGPGDYHRAAPGSRHDRIHSRGGCVLLIVEAAA
jgi:anti-sigma factor ChrR (cupin superfamily)